MRTIPQIPADLVIFTGEIPNEKLNFLCSVCAPTDLHKIFLQSGKPVSQYKSTPLKRYAPVLLS